MGETELDPIEERLQPLAQAIGRAVLGAAALERLLVVDIAQRRATSAGVTKQLERELASLERKPAGRLLKVLRELAIPADLAGRIEEFVARRNWLVHRFMDDPDAFRAFATGHDIQPLVERVDQIAADCQALVNEIAPGAFSGAERALEAPFDELLTRLQALDPNEIDDDELRAQVEMARALDPSDFKSVGESEHTPPRGDSE